MGLPCRLYNEWFCARCQRVGSSRLESEAATGGFPPLKSKGGGKGKGVYRKAQYPGRPGDGALSNVPPTT